MIRYICLSLLGLLLMYTGNIAAEVIDNKHIVCGNDCPDLQKGNNNDKKNHFSPKAFQKELEAFIVREASLTPNEAEKFFPLYREMGKKQREIFNKIRHINRTRPSDSNEYKKCVTERDKLDIELKKIQQTYHNKFFTVLSAKKVFEVLRAEDLFHRQMLNKRNNTPRTKKGR